jgi:precorrin-6B methylase 2
MNDDAATKLVAEVIALSKNEQRRNELKQNIGKLGVTNADDSIATQVLNDLN